MKTSIVFSLFGLLAVSCTFIQGEGPAAGPAQPPTAEILLETPATAPGSFSGAVQIAGGSCCIVGYDGETLQAHVSFSAASPSGRVNKMRVASGCTLNTDLEAVDWEAFTTSKTYPVPVAINWTGFYLCVQYQDEQGNVSPVYRDDISVEGMPRPPLVNPSDWYPQIQCFSEQDVTPGAGEVVTGTNITFRWPDTNQLPDGVFYKVFVYGANDGFAGTAASGQTTGTSVTLQIDPARAGEIGWYIVLVDANGTQLDHGQCSSFPASLLTVDPPDGLKAVLFNYQP